MADRSNSPSLLILGLPRSLTTAIYRWFLDTLTLREPRWTTDGEFLNPERFTIDERSRSESAGAVHFLTSDDGLPFAGCVDLARVVLQSPGQCLKIVTQPFVARAVLSEASLGDLRILRVERRIADVAYAMLHRGWHYPARVGAGDSLPECLVRGLVRASRAMTQDIDAVEVHYDDLVVNPDALPQAARRLVPERQFAEQRPFLTPEFIAQRDAVMARRETPEYRELEALVQRIESEDSAPASASRVSVGAEARRPVLLAIGDAVAPTGFSRVTRHILEGANAHFEVHQVGLKYPGGPHDLPWTVHPCTDQRGGARLASLCAELDPKLLFMVNDVWVMAGYLEELRRIGSRARTIAYCPVDGDPVSPQHVLGIQGIDHLVAYTEYGRRELERAAERVPSAVTWGDIEVEPHGVDTGVFHPLYEFGEDIVAARRRARAQIFPNKPELADAFIVLNANRNQPRKRVDLTMLGFSQFARTRPDAWLYLHMGTEDQGWNIKELADRLGISDRVLISVDSRYQPGLSLETLNLIYNATDVGINTSSSEGWGLVPFEHGATGAAQIVPNNTASAALWRGHAELLDTALELISPGISSRTYLTSPEQVAARLAALYDDRELLARRCKDAYEHATDRRFQWPDIAARWAARFQRELSLAESR